MTIDVVCPHCHKSHPWEPSREQMDMIRHAPRRIGPRTLHNRFHAHCQDIAEQDKRYTKEQWSALFKNWAANMQVWRVYEDPVYGDKLPVSESMATEEEVLNINRFVIQPFADKEGYWLREYVDPKDPRKGTYKSREGRTYEEMVR